MSASVTDDRAVAARAFVRARRRRVRPSPYQIYATVVICAIVGALGHGVISSLVGSGLTLHGLAVSGPSLLLIGLLGAARFGRWQGPVSFSPADVLLLLMAPLEAAALVRPKLEHGLLAGAACGAAVGVLLILVVAGGPAGLGAGRSVGGVSGIAAVAVLAVAISWLVQSSRRSLPLLRRTSPMVFVLAVGLVLLNSTVNTAIGVWSGPWGWAIAPLAGQQGWPLALGLLVLTALATATWARRRAGSASVEMFMARAGTRSALGGAALSLDYRSAALVYRAAQPHTRAWLPQVRVPPPAGARWVIPWRDAVAAWRGPSRAAWAAGLCAATTLEALSHPGKLLPSLLAAVGLYFAAALLAEPLRMDVDAPERRVALLGWSLPRVLLAHCVLPLMVLVPVAAATVAASVLFGVAGVTTLALLPTLLAPALATAVLASALAARRGGRIDEALLLKLLGTDPTNPGAMAFLVILLAPWLLVAAIGDGVAIAIVGHAAAHHHALVSGGVIACLITIGAAAVLRSLARRDA